MLINNFFLTVLVFFAFSLVIAEDKTKTKDDASEKWKKKDIRDYTDADVERLYDQWEDQDDEPLEPDELPEWKRPAPKIDLSQIDPNDPESMLKQTKTGRTLMMFATVSGNPTEKETESISQRWQGSLFNAHYDVQRYVVGSDRVLMVLKDGSMAWPIKDFLVSQDRCELVTIEGKDYPGKGATASKGKSKNTSKSSKSKENKKKKQKDKETDTHTREDL